MTSWRVQPVASVTSRTVTVLSLPEGPPVTESSTKVMPQGSRSEMTGWESTTVEVLFAVTLKVTSEPGDARLPLIVDLAL